MPLHNPLQLSSPWVFYWLADLTTKSESPEAMAARAAAPQQVVQATVDMDKWELTRILAEMMLGRYAWLLNGI